MSTVAFSPAAATSPVAVRRVVIGAMFKHVLARWRMFTNRRVALGLHDLTDHELADIGLSRSDLSRVLAGTGLAEDPTRELAAIAGMRARACL